MKRVKKPKKYESGGGLEKMKSLGLDPISMGIQSGTDILTTGLSTIGDDTLTTGQKVGKSLVSGIPFIGSALGSLFKDKNAQEKEEKQIRLDRYNSGTLFSKDGGIMPPSSKFSIHPTRKSKSKAPITKLTPDMDLVGTSTSFTHNSNDDIPADANNDGNPEILMEGGEIITKDHKNQPYMLNKKISSKYKSKFASLSKGDNISKKTLEHLKSNAIKANDKNLISKGLSDRTSAFGGMITQEKGYANGEGGTIKKETVNLSPKSYERLAKDKPVMTPQEFQKYLSDTNRTNIKTYQVGKPNPGFQVKEEGGMLDTYKHAGKIHINPKNKGKFNALKARTGKSTEELTHSKNPLTRKRAIFAQNAKKWKHEDGGEYEPADLQEEKFNNLLKNNNGTLDFNKYFNPGEPLRTVPQILPKLTPPIQNYNLPEPGLTTPNNTNRLRFKPKSAGFPSSNFGKKLQFNYDLPLANKDNKLPNNDGKNYNFPDTNKTDIVDNTSNRERLTTGEAIAGTGALLGTGLKALALKRNKSLPFKLSDISSNLGESYSKALSGLDFGENEAIKDIQGKTNQALDFSSNPSYQSRLANSRNVLKGQASNIAQTRGQFSNLRANMRGQFASDLARQTSQNRTIENQVNQQEIDKRTQGWMDISQDLVNNSFNTANLSNARKYRQDLDSDYEWDGSTYKRVKKTQFGGKIRKPKSK